MKKTSIILIAIAACIVIIPLLFPVLFWAINISPLDPISIEKITKSVESKKIIVIEKLKTNTTSFSYMVSINQDCENDSTLLLLNKLAAKYLTTKTNGDTLFISYKIPNDEEIQFYQLQKTRNLNIKLTLSDSTDLSVISKNYWTKLDIDSLKLDRLNLEHLNGLDLNITHCKIGDFTASGDTRQTKASIKNNRITTMNLDIDHIDFNLNENTVNRINLKATHKDSKIDLGRNNITEKIQWNVNGNTNLNVKFARTSAEIVLK